MAEASHLERQLHALVRGPKAEPGVEPVRVQAPFVRGQLGLFTLSAYISATIAPICALCALARWAKLSYDTR